jgi:glutamine amidotransferase
MITVLDYGLGNVAAFVNIYKRLNLPVEVASTTGQLAKAEKIILPGVGAFDWAMTRLNESGMRDCLDDLVMVKKKPVLGVCVGMQMMAKRSDEGKLPGLGWIDADVYRFDETGFLHQTRLPHMGWNDVIPRDSNCLFKGLLAPRFYFLHSYYFSPVSPDDVLGVTDYNGNFTSVVRHANVFGTQFHPEKSHQWGITLLENFSEL